MRIWGWKDKLELPSVLVSQAEKGSGIWFLGMLDLFSMGR